MHVERIDVLSYSGSKGEERPVTFVLQELRIDVLEITGSWIEEGYRDRARTSLLPMPGATLGLVNNH